MLTFLQGALQSADKADQLFPRRLISCSRVKIPTSQSFVHFLQNRNITSPFLLKFTSYSKITIHTVLKSMKSNRHLKSRKFNSEDITRECKHEGAKRKERRRCEMEKPPSRRTEARPGLSFSPGTHTQGRRQTHTPNSHLYHPQKLLIHNDTRRRMPGTQYTEAGITTSTRRGGTHS